MYLGNPQPFYQPLMSELSHHIQISSCSSSASSSSSPNIHHSLPRYQRHSLQFKHQSHLEAGRYPLPTQQLLPQQHPQYLQVNNSSQQYSKQSPQQHVEIHDLKRAEKSRADALEDRVKQLEEMLSQNIEKVSCQTLEAFHHLRNQFFNPSTAYEQDCIQRIKNLQQMESKREKDNLQKLEGQEKKMEEQRKMLSKTRQQLEEEMQKINEKADEREKSAGSEKAQVFSNSLKKQAAEVSNILKLIEQKMGKFEERVQLKIQEEVKRFQALIKQTKTRNQNVYLREKEGESREMIEKRKKEKSAMKKEWSKIMETPEKLVDRICEAKNCLY